MSIDLDRFRLEASESGRTLTIDPGELLALVAAVEAAQYLDVMLTIEGHATECPVGDAWGELRGALSAFAVGHTTEGGTDGE